MTRTLAILIFLLFSAGISRGEATIFMGTGFADGDDESRAVGVSGDGRVVVGKSGRDAAFWTETNGWTKLPDLGPGLLNFPQGSASSASFDGSTVVGAASEPAALSVRAVRWVDGTPELFATPGEPTVASDVSGDGSVIVGNGFRFTTEGELELLDFGFGGVSRDGRTGVGFRVVSTRPTVTGIAAWTEEDGPIDLGALPGDDGTRRSLATAASADGSVVVGTANISTLDKRPFLWTAESGIRELGAIAGEPFDGEAADVSDDGAIVVGRASFEAYVFDPLNGMQFLKPYLESEFGLDLSGWDLEAASGISADGLTLVGTGTNPLGELEGWRVRLPYRPGDVVRIDVRPATSKNVIRAGGRGLVPVALFGSSALDAGDVDESRLAFGPAGAAPFFVLPAPFLDLDHDGFRDLLLFFRAADLGLAPADTEACLEGRTFPGMPFAGCDAVRVVEGCGTRDRGALAFVPLAWVLARKGKRISR